MSQPRDPGDVVGQELERDDGEQGLDDLGHVGDRQEDVGERARSSSPSVPTAMTGPCRALTSSTLLRVLAWSEPRGATKTLGVSGSIRAIGPCFISAVG